MKRLETILRNFPTPEEQKEYINHASTVIHILENYGFTPEATHVLSFKCPRQTPEGSILTKLANYKNNRNFGCFLRYDSPETGFNKILKDVPENHPIIILDVLSINTDEGGKDPSITSVGCGAIKRFLENYTKVQDKENGDKPKSGQTNQSRTDSYCLRNILTPYANKILTAHDEESRFKKAFEIEYKVIEDDTHKLMKKLELTNNKIAFIEEINITRAYQTFPYLKKVEIRHSSIKSILTW